MNETILSENNNWSTILILDKYDEKGKPILYEIDENEVPTRYEKHIEQTIVNNTKTYYITNNYQLNSISKLNKLLKK